MWIDTVFACIILALVYIVSTMGVAILLNIANTDGEFVFSVTVWAWFLGMFEFVTAALLYWRV